MSCVSQSYLCSSASMPRDAVHFTRLAFGQGPHITVSSKQAMSNSSSDIKTDGEKKREKERGKERQRKPPLLLPLRKNAQKSDLCGSDAATIQRLQFT